MLERVEKRSKALGITGTSSFPITPDEKENIGKKASESNKKQQRLVSSPKKQSSPRKISNASPRRISTPKKTVSDKLEVVAGTTRTVKNNVDKNDADVAVEVNITSNQNIQVEVEVAEYELDSAGNMIKKSETTTYENLESAPTPLRDHSRKNLRRLEALYSENEQIASPIQRTEGTFCAEDKTNESRPLKKFSKLAALAQDINSWDDDYGRHNAPTIKGAIPKSNSSPMKKTPEKNRNQAVFGSPQKNFSPTAHLKWDKKVIDSLEAQGFTRRESTVPKLVYDYVDKPSTSKATFIPTTPTKSIPSTYKSPAKSNAPPPPKPPTATQFNSPQKPIIKATEIKHVTPTKKTEMKISTPSKSVTFSSSVHQRSQKDPAEMSLKVTGIIIKRF